MTRFVALSFLVALAACKSDPVTLEFAGEAMGTTYAIVAVDKTAELDPTAIQASVDQTLAAVNASMSNWDPNSEISRFNAQTSTEPQPISEELHSVMSAAMDVHLASEGQFDVTLGPLIQLWGFGQRTSESPVPEDVAIADALEVVGQDKIVSLTSSPFTMAKALPDTNVWVAAIAKGYGVDAIAAELRNLGLEDYMVEIGGDLVTAGNNPSGTPWRIGIERPDAGVGAVEEVVDLSGLGMATSGDYRNYFEEDGVRYSHIIDAISGRPITHTTASVTVLADDAMTADAWATALLALGTERGMPIAEAQNLGAFFIDRDPAAGEGQFKIAQSSRFTDLQAEK
ncbi:MAG: FAD:protein FMN transferase [Marinovum sp.]|nr:FAD:protein FMN transferase [Marinovum sp.]